MLLKELWARWLQQRVPSAVQHMSTGTSMGPQLRPEAVTKSVLAAIAALACDHTATQTCFTRMAGHSCLLTLFTLIGGSSQGLFLLLV